MNRFITFTSVALIGSLSLLGGSTASAQFDFDGIVDRLERRVENEIFGNGNRGRGWGSGYQDGGYYDDRYYNNYDSRYYDNGRYYNDNYYQNGYRYDDDYRNHRGHQHYIQRPTVVNEGLPYPGLVSGEFGGMGNTHELAMNVRYLANQITFDMHHNYQFNPGFQEIYAKCYSFRNQAYAVHDMEHARQHVEMTAALNELDSMFHSLQQDIAGWRRTGQVQIGQGDIHHKMELLEEMLHHLMNDAGVRSQYVIDADDTPPPPTTGVIRSQPVRQVQ